MIYLSEICVRIVGPRRHVKVEVGKQVPIRYPQTRVSKNLIGNVKRNIIAVAWQRQHVSVWNTCIPDLVPSRSSFLKCYCIRMDSCLAVRLLVNRRSCIWTFMTNKIFIILYFIDGWNKFPDRIFLHTFNKNNNQRNVSKRKINIQLLRFYKSWKWAEFRSNKHQHIAICISHKELISSIDNFHPDIIFNLDIIITS